MATLIASIYYLLVWGLVVEVVEGGGDIVIGSLRPGVCWIWWLGICGSCALEICFSCSIILPFLSILENLTTSPLMTSSS
jgi:hypothetical protein